MAVLKSHEATRAAREAARATVTGLLEVWGERNEATESRLFDEIYPHLLEIANRLLSHERGHHTLDPPALVHEAFLRLLAQRRNRWRNRGHFYSVAATVMRRVLRDYGRRRGALKRAAATRAVPLEEDLLSVELPDVRIESLEEALEVLLDEDAHLASVVELRFFGGLTLEEVATVLNKSRTAIVADWGRARAWLATHLEQPS